MNATRIRAALLAGVRALGLSVASVAVSCVLFSLTLLSLVLVGIGVGVFTTPVVLGWVRAWADHRRRLAASWSDVRIDVPYRALPADIRSGVTGQVERTSLMLKDPATWRDLQWLFVDLSAGAVTALVPGLTLWYWLYGLVIAAGLWRVFAHSGGEWFLFVRVHSQFTGLLALALGLGILALGLRYNTTLLRAHFRLAKCFLAPTKEASLALRVAKLTETRHDALDTSAAELRRIERDLHDGAQARLVAMGMNLGTIEALIEKDPAKAKKLIGVARASSAEALTELRDLVRGIHPPVLAERGLGDAVRALALRLPIETEVTVDLPGRSEAPVESAAYFAVSEVLTNAVKHSGADRIWVDLHHTGTGRDGMIRVSVTDNGCGGARIGAGSGLSGVERRLGTFDGVLAVSSPAGGPTMVTMEIPCASC
ncbi:sensor histidine kinase [Streptomyces candidus]|uniref:histidine kinase n=1 Tax=Streptomyces candidus TaxID=67283 RepID=A0A7X0HCQ4_9ACTN|nr:histidine kinase [Streptomyces candidus]MBB6433852.1 signal transduction histidine kinase [Streptomyces candidus]GHH34308.1 histidine kinase [Streptomyces candidus]